MRILYEPYKLLLLIDNRLTKKIFLQKCGAEKGYSHALFSRMYDCIFSELIEVNKEYKKYYSFEYSSMEYYLFKKFNLEKNTILKINQLIKSNNNLKLFRKNEFSYGDYGLEQFAFSESMNEKISNILQLKK